LSFQTGDVRDYVFPEGRFSHVIHAATQASAKLNVDDPLAMFDTIVEGTRRTLEFAAHTGTRKFLLTSSGAVYGKQPPQLTHVAEDYSGAPDPMEPCTVYGQGKRAAEHLGALYSRLHDFEVKIARGFAFVGPHLPLDTHFAIGNFIGDALRGDPVNVQGDGTPYRSYLYAADLAIWLWTILFRGQSCRPYNVGSDESLSIAALAQRVDQWMGPRGVRIARSSAAVGPAERYVPDIGRAKRELDLKVQVSLEVAVRRTAAYSKLGMTPV
jgi:dTDP-glucose 4,6-dehydratase